MKMKKVFVVALLLVGIASFAQDKKQDLKAMPLEKRIEFHVNKLKGDLTLTDDQATRVTELYTANAQKRDERVAKIKEMKTDSKKLSAEEKELLKNQMDEKQMATEEQMRAILTPEQFTKWQSMRDSRQERMAQKKEEKKATKATK
jgi:periplasmic protein CpxP/Spy